MKYNKLSGKLLEPPSNNPLCKRHKNNQASRELLQGITVRISNVFLSPNTLNIFYFEPKIILIVRKPSRSGVAIILGLMYTKIDAYSNCYKSHECNKL